MACCAEDALVSLLVNPRKKPVANPIDVLLGARNAREPGPAMRSKVAIAYRREQVLEQLRRGQLEDNEIEVEVKKLPQLEVAATPSTSAI